MKHFLLAVCLFMGATTFAAPAESNAELPGCSLGGGVWTDYYCGYQHYTGYTEACSVTCAAGQTPVCQHDGCNNDGTDNAHINNCSCH